MVTNDLFDVLGPPAGAVVSNDNYEYYWTSMENSRHSLIVTIDKDGKVIKHNLQ